MANADELLTVEEVAERVKVNPETVRRWIKGGRLSAVKPAGGAYRIHTSDLERLFGAPPKAQASPPSESEERRPYEAELAEAGYARGEAAHIRERIERMRGETEQLLVAQDATAAIRAEELRGLSSRVSELGDQATTRREAWQDEHLAPARSEGRPSNVLQRLEGVLAEFLAAERQASTLGKRLQEALDYERIERTLPLLQEEEQAEQRGAR